MWHQVARRWKSLKVFGKDCSLLKYERVRWEQCRQRGGEWGGFYKVTDENLESTKCLGYATWYFWELLWIIIKLFMMQLSFAAICFCGVWIKTLLALTLCRNQMCRGVPGWNRFLFRRTINRSLINWAWIYHRHAWWFVLRRQMIWHDSATHVNTHSLSRIDCAGILKLRNSDIELRKGETDIGRKNTRVRMVFRVHINQPTGRTVSLQAASNPIECCEYTCSSWKVYVAELTSVTVICSFMLQCLSA